MSDVSPRTLVVIPTFNEADNIARIVGAVLSQGPDIHVLVVDDNSPDGTGEMAAELARRNERVHALRREGKHGLGRAYLAGFRWGLEREYEQFCEMDADFSHPPNRLPVLIEKSAEYAVVIGSRYVGGRVNVVNWPMSRLLISLFGSWYARSITGLPIRDATGGFNLWRREVLEAVDLDRIESNGYAFQIELKYRAWQRGFSLVEIPIVFTERQSGESKMSKAIMREAVWKVWKLRLLNLFGRL